MKKSLALVLFCLGLGSLSFSSTEGLVKSNNGNNHSLIVGVPNGLPGINLDVKMVQKISDHAEHKFKSTLLENSLGTTSNISKELTRLAQGSGEDGTLLFYFSGHGNRGVISVKDRLMKVNEIRSAIELGRQNMGPLKRLVMMFDSCYSGTLLDPFRVLFTPFLGNEMESTLFADAIFDGLQEGEGTYWDSLFVFAACRANQTSLASYKGSIFTLALAKAFDESMAQNATMREFVAKTQAYTKGHNPVARFVPADFENEKMR